jgi:hypothetical protein
VQKMTVYEQRHPELYQDKFKRQVVMVDAEDSEDSLQSWSGHGGQSLCPASG